MSSKQNFGVYTSFVFISFAAFVLYKVIEEDRHLRSVLQKIRPKENLAILGQMSSNIIHEIRNPLTTIKVLVRC